ncbi:hypothetical protein QOT17_004369 [Balamuthia mandrillaris]
MAVFSSNVCNISLIVCSCNMQPHVNTAATNMCTTISMPVISQITALNFITITNNMPGPNDPICALMTINGHRVTAVIDSGASHSFMDSSIVDLSQASANAISITCSQPDSQSIILGHDFMHKSGMAVKEHIHKHILEAIKKYLQENETSLTGPSCILPEVFLHLDTGDHPPVFRHQYPILHHLMLIINLQVAELLHTSVFMLASLDSPWNSLLTVMPKKDADSNITHIISKVQGFFITSALDLIWSYMQCPSAPKDCVKTSFTSNGHCYMLSPFLASKSLHNTSSTS